MLRVGIDIGGTQLRAALFDEDYTVLEIYRTDNDKRLSCRQNVDKLICFIRNADAKIAGIGVGVPGPADIPGGRMLNPPNLCGWDNFPIVDYLQQNTGLRTILNNDGNVAALGEALRGNGRGYVSVAFIGLSTGCGGGFVFNGKIWNGAHGNGAEWWNMIVNEDARAHKNANAGSLNEQVSGSGFEAAARQIYERDMSAREVFERFYNKEPAATQLVETTADTLGKGIANIACTFDPEIFVIGGSVAANNPKYVEMAAERAKRYMIMPEGLLVKPSMLGDDAGLIGAALLLDTNQADGACCRRGGF